MFHNISNNYVKNGGQGSFKTAVLSFYLYALTFLFLLLIAALNKCIWLEIQSEFNVDILYQKGT